MVVDVIGALLGLFALCDFMGSLEGEGSLGALTMLGLLVLQGRHVDMSIHRVVFIQDPILALPLNEVDC